MIVLGLNEIEMDIKMITFFNNVVMDGLIRNTKRLGIRIHKSVNFQGRCKVVYLQTAFQHFFTVVRSFLFIYSQYSF